ncbi:BACON domain-containing protein [Cerasicoccus fimbriatus]|uniref:BACON domain-containing protein n=1 Tax=Cerasicoccus fimbriatus TaxID=3014554 RepID=UPI0022B465A8|nr:hypothetical protein [Cerasicoccus sp. TK19100]
MEKYPLRHLMAVICTLSSPLVCPALNMLDNPGFESGLSSWSGISSESTDAYEGSLAGCINQNTWWRLASQAVECDPGQIVNFGGYLKTESIVSGSAGIRLKFLDASDQTIETWHAGSLSGDTGYSLLQENVVAPAGTDTAKLELYVGKSTSTLGYAYYDSLFVDVFSHKDILLNTNGGFEEGYDDWTKGHANLVTGSDAYSGVNASSLLHGTFWKQSWYEFSCDPGKEYAISFAAATVDVTSTASYQMRYYDNNGDWIATDGLLSLDGTNDYALYYADGVVPPAGAVTARFLFAASKPGSGMSYLDDLVISTDADGLSASPGFIDQDLVNVIPDPGMEGTLSEWPGNVTADTTEIVAGTQSARFTGHSFFKAYAHDLIPATEGKYYSMSANVKIENVAIAPSLIFRFVAADGTTVLDKSPSIIGIEGTAPFREYNGSYVLAPAGTAYIEPVLSFPKLNPGALLWLDEVYINESQNLPVRLVPTYESLSVYVSRDAQLSGEVAHIFYRESGESIWNEAYEPIYDPERGEYRGSIVGLYEDTDYEVQVVLESGGTAIEEAGAAISTWSSTPVIAQTLSVASLYSGGQLLIEDMHGAPDGWIKITGTGANDIDGGYANDVALLVLNSSYLLFENIEIEGGRLHAVQVNMSDQIRLVNCEMSGWARSPNYTDGKYSYETQADLNADKPINKDAAVHLYGSQRVTIDRCYMHDPRLGANNWEGSNHPAGPTALYVQNSTPGNGDHLRGNFVVRYNDMVGSDELRWNDAIEGENNNSKFGSVARDSDIYGNMLAFGNDDGIELDGGQMNVRFFGNRIESCFVGLSLAPCVVGPSYVYRNLLFNSGDDRGARFAVVKLGGGSTYSTGKSFFFHNTIYSYGNGITGVGFGNDANRSMFLGRTRNNLIHSLSDTTHWGRTIADSEQNPWNDFDYDNLSNAGLSSAIVEYASGQEANGILDDSPVFINAAVGDFRLDASSSGVDDGVALFNFADQYQAGAPDQGAYEQGQSSLFPMRPMDVSADKYSLELTAVAGGSSTPVNVTLTTGAIGSSIGYTVRMNDTVDWLNVSPSSGVLNSSSTQVLAFSVDASGLSTGDVMKAAALIKFDNGLSVPVTVKATIQ